MPIQCCCSFVSHLDLSARFWRSKDQVFPRLNIPSIKFWWAGSDTKIVGCREMMATIYKFWARWDKFNFPAWCLLFPPCPAARCWWRWWLFPHFLGCGQGGHWAGGERASGVDGQHWLINGGHKRLLVSFMFILRCSNNLKTWKKIFF